MVLLLAAGLAVAQGALKVTDLRRQRATADFRRVDPSQRAAKGGGKLRGVENIP